MLVKILLGVAAVLAVFAAIVATRPSAYHVERKVDVAAPPDVVFGVLDDLRKFAGVWVLFGAPFETAAAQKTFAGPAVGVGQSLAWSGKDAGEGTLAIVESIPGRKVGMQLAFVEPMASKATYALTVAPSSTGSLVTWSMDGDHNFVGKAFGLFVDMDAMIGADVEKALARLQTVAAGGR
jgi:hypothetical protein